MPYKDPERRRAYAQRAEVKARNRVRQRRYQQSAKGKAVRARYLATMKGRARTAARRARYAATAAGKAAHKRHVARWLGKHPGAAQAKAAVNNAVAAGKLARPARCQACGVAGRIQAHHWCGYAPEHWLHVEWLCLRCHRAAHAREGEQ